MTVYRIAKWESVFENAESRKLKKLNWVAMPVGFSSTGYQSMLDEFGDDASAIYGAWCALTGIAASCAVRGVLGNSRGNPLKISHIARITGFRSDVFDRLFVWAASEEVGWLEPLSAEEVAQIYLENAVFPGKTDGSGESPDDPPTCPENFPATGKGREGPDRTGQDKEKQLAAAIAADGQLDFSPLEGTGRVSEAATKLAKAIEKRQILGLSSDWIWSHAAIGELLKPGFIPDAASKILERQINKPKAYIEKALREECDAIGIKIGAAILSVPPKPTRQEPAHV